MSTLSAAKQLRPSKLVMVCALAALPVCQGSFVDQLAAITNRVGAIFGIQPDAGMGGVTPDDWARARSDCYARHAREVDLTDDGLAAKDWMQKYMEQLKIVSNIDDKLTPDQRITHAGCQQRTIERLVQVELDRTGEVLIPHGPQDLSLQLQHGWLRRHANPRIKFLQTRYRSAGDFIRVQNEYVDCVERNKRKQCCKRITAAAGLAAGAVAFAYALL